jgi:glyoxylase-like metal-dependent hydrolase (beta-lactamase superfamily II)
VLFPGDAAAGRRNGRVRRTPRIATAESASISKLADLRFEFAVFGHGGAISRARAAVSRTRGAAVAVNLGVSRFEISAG